jgi:hypothetical protein
VKNDKGLTITCGERWGGFDNTIFGTWCFRGVTRYKVVGSLFRGQTRNGGKYTESVAREHDDVGWLPICDTGDFCIGDVFNRIGTSSVFSDGHIVVVWFSVCRVVDDVLED